MFPSRQKRKDYTSRGEEQPVDNMKFTWVFCILLPIATITLISTKRLSLTCAAVLFPIVLAILQGSLAIVKYRVYFGDAPIPQTPSHGVVVVHPEDVNDDSSTTESQSASQSQSSQESSHHSESPAQQASSSSPTELKTTATTVPTLVSLGCDCTCAHLNQQWKEFLPSTLRETPLRLLVIGDSLAIGVGQAKSSTPVMPEVIAKTLSKQLGGRVVYWTCHGAPGASTGWIVREIERGVSRAAAARSWSATISDCKSCGGRRSPHNDRDDDGDDDDNLESLSHCSDTDESSSDEMSSTGEMPPCSRSGVVGEDGNNTAYVRHCIRNDPALSQWKDSLTQHRQRFDDPDVLGPYDVVVVLTGSNDLKSAFFPFLLKGEDLEFRRQAKERGGSYTKELRRLLETLNERMQRRLQDIRQKVEIATETVRGKVEETIEYIAPGSNIRLPSPSHKSHRQPAGKSLMRDDNNSHEDMDLSTRAASRQFPLVVLPGMPSRSLPIFQSIPLRWFAVPVCDIMDMHKRNFASAHSGEVLFIPPPSMKDMVDYHEKNSEFWSQRENEHTVLALRDILKKDRLQIEGDMRQYYQMKAESMKWSIFTLLHSLSGRCPTAPIFSVDNVHPRDDGYDFWGRYIGNAIAKEMHNKVHSS